MRPRQREDADMKRELRPHQTRAIEMLRESLRSGKGKLILQAPTGFGKTLLGAAVVERALARQKRVIYTVPALSLVDQTLQALWEEGIRDVGVIQGTHAMTDWSRPIQVASVQTLQRRQLPHADVALIDECHHWFEFYERWMKDPAWQSRPFIGLSATPWTRGLGQYFNDLIVAATTQELISGGYLSPFRVFAPSHPDLTKVRTLAGDYHEADLSGVMNDAHLLADVVDTWRRRAENRSTFCFAVDRAHAKHLQAKFEEAGISTGYIDAYTSTNERNEIKRRFHDGSIRVVCNVGCLTTGVDWDVRCIVLARPTKSEILFVQIIGRGLRTAEGKEDCLILDHSDTHLRLGFVTDIYHEVLDDGRTRAKPKATDRVRLPKECPQCAFLKPPGTSKCPACGFKTEAVDSTKVADGELVEITGRNNRKDAASNDERASFYAQLKGYAQERGYSSGWAAHKFREKFGDWPNDCRNVPAVEPTLKVRSWIKSRQIAWAKRKERHAQQATA
jgi:superfamily II DNA or RNA helicase